MGSSFSFQKQVMKQNMKHAHQFKGSEGLRNQKSEAKYRFKAGGKVHNQGVWSEGRQDEMVLKLIGQLVSNFDDVRISQVPREENFEADEVARLASSNSDTRWLGLYVEVQTISSI